MSKLVILALSLLSSASSFAGPRVVGNGGVSIVCRDPNSHEITEAYLLDLFETENFGSKMPRSEAAPDMQVEKALGRLNQTQGVQLEITRQVRDIKKSAQFISNPRVGLPLTDDALPRLNLKGCQYEQLAIYNPETNILLIDNEIYSSPKLSRTDAAALWVHEAVYKLDRLLNDSKNSVVSRKLVGRLFSGDSDEGLTQDFDARFSRFVILPGQNILWLDTSQDYSVSLFVTGVPLDTVCRVDQGINFEGLSWSMQNGQSYYPNWSYFKAPWLNRVGPWANGVTFVPRMICQTTDARLEFPDAEFTWIISQGHSELMRVRISGFQRELGSELISSVSDSFLLRFR